MKNEHGGILSKLFAIPIGTALMAGFFFLGYYVGKYQSKSGTQYETLPSLPKVLSQNLPKKEEFTFYKTLTDKNESMVSIDLKPKQANEESKAEKKPTAAEAQKSKAVSPAPKKKDLEITIVKDTSGTAHQKQIASKQAPQRKESTPAVSSTAKARYTLQIASYPDKASAEADVKKMMQRGYAAFIVSADVPGKGTWYRVRVGSFPKTAYAEKLQKEIRAKEGLSSIIVME